MYKRVQRYLEKKRFRFKSLECFVCSRLLQNLFVTFYMKNVCENSLLSVRRSFVRQERKTFNIEILLIVQEFLSFVRKFFKIVAQINEMKFRRNRATD